MDKTLGRIVNVGLLVGLLYVGLAPQSPIQRDVAEWRRTRATTRAVGKNWEELAASPVVLGPADGSVGVVEFIDYQCPACRQSHEALLTAFPKTAGGALAVRQMPLSDIHPSADAAARASICAEEQGLLPEMHAHLLSSAEWMEDAVWRQVAETVGVPDLDRFETCLSSEATNRQLERDKALIADLHLIGTPSFVWPGGVRFGMLTPEDLDAIRGG